MSLEKMKRNNRNLREKVQSVIEKECKQLGEEQTNEYHMFVNGKNTGEIIKLPEKLKEHICDAISNQLKIDISLSYRNIYLAS